MATAKICDRCGEVFAYHPEVERERSYMIHKRNEINDLKSGCKELDICDACYRAFISYVFNGGQNDENH